MEKSNFDYQNISGLPSAPPHFQEDMRLTGAEYPPHCTAPPIPAPQRTFTVNDPPQQIHVAVFGRNPNNMQCPYCRNSVITNVEKESSTLTHIACFVLFLVGCWPCCCIPYCIDSLKTTRHTCPSCGNFLGECKP